MAQLARVGWVMGTLVLRTILAIFLGLANTVSIAAASDDQDTIQFVVGTRAQTTDAWEYGASAIVPFMPDLAGYGWVTKLSSRKEVTITEILTLPARPNVFPAEGKLSKDGRTLTVTRKRTPSKDFFIGNFWTVAEGDPIGPHSYTILLDGVPIKTFHFTVGVLPAPTTPSQQDFAPLFKQILEKKREAVGYWQACLEQASITPVEYYLLTNQEALTRADQLIARHQQLSQRWQQCRTVMQSRVQAVQQEFKMVLPFMEDYGRTDARVKGLAVALTRTISAMATRVDELSKQIIQIHRLYEHFFRTLRNTPPAARQSIIAIPDEIDQLERQIVRTMRATTDDHVAELELIYKLYPSVPLAARLDNAKIMQTVGRAVEIFYESDSRNDIQRLRDAQKGLQLAAFQAKQLSRNPELMAARPELEDKYETVINDLNEMYDVFNIYLAFHKLTTSEAASLANDPEFLNLLTKSLHALEQTGSRLDQRLLLLDSVLAQQTVQ